jgi:type I restriction enzyme S subunit
LSRRLPEGTLVLSNSGTVCVPKILNVEGCIHDGFVTFVGLEKVLLRDFAYWWFEYVRPAIIEENRQGVTQVNLNTGIVSEIQLPVPPRPEQQRVVDQIEASLTDLNAAVAALKRVLANLKRYRASVLKAACEGRLVPTEGELAHKEGRPYETGEQLLKRILVERRAKWEADQLAKMPAAGKPPKSDDWKKKYKEPEPLDSSVLSTLPEGWVWASWEQLSVRVTVGHVGPMKNEYVPSGVPFLRSQNVRANRFDPEGLLSVSAQFHKALSKSVLHPRDLVVVRSGSVGTTCVIPEFLGECNCADLVLIQNPTGVLPEFGAYYMNSAANSLIQASKVGVALIHFNTNSVAKLPVPLPPMAEQIRVTAEVSRRLSVVDELELAITRHMHRADRLRQAILKRAFEGKLVPQDPNDEPASVLLERIRAQRENSSKQKPRSRRARTVDAAGVNG